MFVRGRLACRVVNILISKSIDKVKPHAGIVRHLYAREADMGAAAGLSQEPGLSRNEPIALDDDDDDDDEFVLVEKRGSLCL
jgi:hypothetical protein